MKGHVGISDYAISVMMDENPHLSRKGFASAIKRIFDGEESIDEIRPMRFVPDAYLLDYANQVVILFEIEDTSTITRDKLMALSMFWFFMDGEGWSVELHIYNRYGVFQGKVCLGTAYYTFMMRSVEDAAEVRE